MDLLLYQPTFLLSKCFIFLFPSFLLVYFRTFTSGAERQRVLFVDYSWHREVAVWILDAGIFTEKKHSETSAAQNYFLFSLQA